MNSEHKKTIRLDFLNWELTLDLKGGRIVSLYCSGQKILGTYNRADNKIGNTHVCIPNFANEGADLALPFHGPSRNSIWKVKNKRRYSIVISCDIPATDLYPAKLHIEQSFTLRDSFVHEIKVTNTKGSAVPLNIGCHYYWDTPKGWEGTMINKRIVNNQIENNGSMSLKEKNEIVFPHTTYRIEQIGFGMAVLWTGFYEKKGEKRFDNVYCCIEPVRGRGNFFGSGASMIKEGQQTATHFKIEPSRVL